MNLVSLAVILAIAAKHIEKLPSSDGVAGVAPPLTGPDTPSLYPHLIPPHVIEPQEKG